VRQLPSPFRKSKKPNGIEDYETWIESEISNTLNCFDVGDIRSTNIVLTDEPKP
jgi:hypothetical protein